jgi:hypothetical protein
MKKSFVIFLIVALSCQSKVDATDITKINGYWEIEKVIFPDGSTKEFDINEVYDYFEIKNSKGIRKKVMPQLDGTFLTNDAFETIEIKDAEGKYNIYYSTALAKWHEEIISLTDKELVLLNSEKKEYHYKKATPINLSGNGKKTQ